MGMKHRLNDTLEEFYELAGALARVFTVVAMVAAAVILAIFVLVKLFGTTPEEFEKKCVQYPNWCEKEKMTKLLEEMRSSTTVLSAPVITR